MDSEDEVDQERWKIEGDPQVYSRPKQTTTKKKAMEKAKEMKKNAPIFPAKKTKLWEEIVKNESNRVEDNINNNGKLEIKEIEYRSLSNALQYEVNKNKQNLENTGLWIFIHWDFDDMEDIRVRKFVKNSIYKTRTAYHIVNKLFSFTTKSVAKVLYIPARLTNIISEASHLTMEEIQEIFEPNAMK